MKPSTSTIFLRALCLTVALLFLPAAGFAEEAEDEDLSDEWGEYAEYLSEDGVSFDGNEVVRDTFGELLLINSPTVQQLSQKTLGLNIQHRFGMISSDFSDMYGIYAPANIRIEFNYGITDWMLLGVGTTKNGSIQDLTYKFAILRQEEPSGMPISVSFYGQATVEGGPAENYDKFAHRAAYFQQILIARKFGHWFSLQLAPSFTHFNVVDEEAGFKNDSFGLSVIGKVRATPTLSVIFEASQGQLFSQPDAEEDRIKPVLGLGIEMETSGHAFQVFASSTNSITSSQAYGLNPYDFAEGEWFFGFNMTRNWNF